MIVRGDGGGGKNALEEAEKGRFQSNYLSTAFPEHLRKTYDKLLLRPRGGGL